MRGNNYFTRSVHDMIEGNTLASLATSTPSILTCPFSYDCLEHWAREPRRGLSKQINVWTFYC